MTVENKLCENQSKLLTAKRVLKWQLNLKQFKESNPAWRMEVRSSIMMLR
jgi:hypothetical protein